MAVDTFKTENKINFENKLTFNFESNESNHFNDGKLITNCEENKNSSFMKLPNKVEDVNHQDHSDNSSTMKLSNRVESVNHQDHSDNSSTMKLSNNSETVNHQDHSDEKFQPYDINSNINGTISIIYDDELQNSMELTVADVSKVAGMELEPDNPRHLQDLEKQKNHEVFDTYKTRFWILAVYCYAAFMMLLIWGTFSPILDSAEYAYDWSDGYFALLEGWGSIFSLITMIPLGVVVHKHGLRVGMIMICVLISIATGIRCVTTNVNAFTYLASISCMINGMCSCVVLSLPPLISVVWFPVNERATATAISSTAMELGITGMYLSPLIVRTQEDGGPSKEEVRSDMQTLMFIYFGMALLALACTLLYFPAAPPSPPSASSKVERVEFITSMKTMIKKLDVMCIILIYTFSTSIPFCWLSIINLSMSCLGISQDESMWIAIAASLISIMMTIVVARLTDYFRGYLKVSIASLLLASSASFLWFLLIVEQVVPASKAQVYISVILGCGLQYSSVPLTMELAVELAYPSPENAVGTMFSAMLELCDVAFLLLMMIPTDCYVWLSYAVVASTCFTVIPLIFVKEVYHRSAIDIENDERTGVPSGTDGTVAHGTYEVTNVTNEKTSDNYAMTHGTNINGVSGVTTGVPSITNGVPSITDGVPSLSNP